MIFAKLLKKKNRGNRLVLAPDMWRTIGCFAASSLFRLFNDSNAMGEHFKKKMELSVGDYFGTSDVGLV